MNLEFLDFEASTFDAVVAVDTIFFGRSMHATIAGMARVLKANGKIAVFNGDYSQEQFLAALAGHGLSCQTHDLTQEHVEHMLLKHRVAREMQKDFEIEGIKFVWENLMAESFADLESIRKMDFNPKARYLYTVQSQNQPIQQRARS